MNGLSVVREGKDSEAIAARIISVLPDVLLLDLRRIVGEYVMPNVHWSRFNSAWQDGFGISGTYDETLQYVGKLDKYPYYAQLNRPISELSRFALRLDCTGPSVVQLLFGANPSVRVRSVLLVRGQSPGVVGSVGHYAEITSGTVLEFSFEQVILLRPIYWNRAKPDELWQLDLPYGPSSHFSVWADHTVTLTILDPETDCCKTFS